MVEGTIRTRKIGSIVTYDRKVFNVMLMMMSGFRYRNVKIGCD